MKVSFKWLRYFGFEIRNYIISDFKSEIASFIFFIVLIAISLSVYAQTPKKQAADDRAPVTVRYPSAKKLNDFRSDRDYQYNYDTRPPESPWAKFREWFWRKVNEFFQSKAYKNFWQYLILAIIAGLVIWLLIKADVLAFMFPKKALDAPLDYENLVEDIHEINFESAIDEAVAQRNFRLAVRLLYLQTLKRLTDAGLIAWKPDKTNRQYVYEVANTPLHPDFDRLTTQFEFVWYGDFPVDETRFQQLKGNFLAFNKEGLRQTTR